MGYDQRDKVRKRLNPKATKSMSFKDMGGIFNKITQRLPIKPKYKMFKGTDTISWRLQTTGAANTATNVFRAKDDGRIEEISIDFAAGSEYQYYIMVLIDGAVIFPSELSQQLRGNDKVRRFSVDIPFQRDARIRINMVSDTGLGVDTIKACFVDFTLRYKPR